jgi:regulator of ribonuclease E activity RraA/HMG-CHA aldolase family protein
MQVSRTQASDASSRIFRQSLTMQPRRAIARIGGTPFSRFRRLALWFSRMSRNAPDLALSSAKCTPISWAPRGCVAAVTNGAVRDLQQVRSTGFQFFAGNVAVSHAYAHIFQFGTSVEIGGLRIEPGDLLHGDQHGILKVPLEIARDIPAKAREIKEKEQRVIAMCRSGDFSLDKLRELFRGLNTEPKDENTGRIKE